MGRPGVLGVVAYDATLSSLTNVMPSILLASIGVAYGCESIPPQWLSCMRGKEVLEACLF